MKFTARQAAAARIRELLERQRPHSSLLDCYVQVDLDGGVLIDIRHPDALELIAALEKDLDVERGEV